jgi:hypothetical protein
VRLGQSRNVVAHREMTAMTAMTARRFPPPWSIEDNGACFVSAIRRESYMIWIASLLLSIFVIGTAQADERFITVSTLFQQTKWRAGMFICRVDQL